MVHFNIVDKWWTHHKHSNIQLQCWMVIKFDVVRWTIINYVTINRRWTMERQCPIIIWWIWKWTALDIILPANVSQFYYRRFILNSSNEKFKKINNVIQLELSSSLSQFCSHWHSGNWIDKTISIDYPFYDCDIFFSFSLFCFIYFSSLSSYKCKMCAICICLNFFSNV